MSAPNHIEQEDLALFAMHLLSSDESTGVTTHLEECSACVRSLGEVQGDLAVYAHTVEMHSPPAAARDRLMKQVAREKKEIPVEQTATTATPVQETAAPVDITYGRSLGLGRGSYLDEEPPKKSFAGRALPWVGWAAAAGLAFTAGNLYQQRDALRSIVAQQSSTMSQMTDDAAAARRVLDTMTDTTAKRVTLTTSPVTKPAPQGRATYVASKGALIFIANNMEPLQPAKVYELWLIPANGAAPIPAGTFHPDAGGNASVIMPPLPKGVDAKAFGVTIENEGGATKPTLPIIMVGA
jgi:hypothetical protein